MIIDEILAHARYLRVDTTPDPMEQLGYRCSYAAWILRKIEQRLAIEDVHGSLRERLERCKTVTWTYEELEAIEAGQQIEGVS